MSGEQERDGLLVVDRCGPGPHAAGGAAPAARTSGTDVRSSPGSGAPAASAGWREDMRLRVHGEMTEFVRRRWAEPPAFVRVGGDADGQGVLALARSVLDEYLAGGKYLRSTFGYLGWLCGREESAAALRAVASLELLHVMALIQDDVMDDSSVRRGRPAAHVTLARWHRGRGLSGDCGAFGRSAATLLADLCLVWAEQAWRTSGVDAAALARAWTCYDSLRGELAVGQLLDLTQDLHRPRSTANALSTARRKSGNYTVRRPLELGAHLAGCPPLVLHTLGRYGSLVADAFQIRDDLRDWFEPDRVDASRSSETSRTQEAAQARAADVRAGRGNIVTALAHEMAGSGARAEMAELAGAAEIDGRVLARWQQVLTETGARARAESLIAGRTQTAVRLLADGGIPAFARGALAELAAVCAEAQPHDVARR